MYNPTGVKYTYIQRCNTVKFDNAQNKKVLSTVQGRRNSITKVTWKISN